LQAAVSGEDGGSAQCESLPRLQDFGFLADWGFVVPHPLQVILTYFIAMFTQVETRDFSKHNEVFVIPQRNSLKFGVKLVNFNVFTGTSRAFSSMDGTHSSA
jgi:hypothetical protein